MVPYRTNPRSPWACRLLGVGLAVAFCVLASDGFIRADDKKSGAEEHAVLAKSTSDSATLIRPAADKPWQLLDKGGEVSSGQLVMGGGESALETANGRVALGLKGDLSATSPYPVLETAIVLHPPKDADADVTLERGRLDLTNLNKTGPARVRVHVAGRTAVLELKDPGSSVALEIFGRWPPGSTFVKEPKKGHGPPIAALALVTKGEVEFRGPLRHFGLKAPPGPAIVHTEHFGDILTSPEHLDKLPKWAEGDADSPAGKKVRENMEKFRTLAKAKSVADAAEAMAKSDDASERQTGVLLLAATDDLQRLRDVLMTTKHQDVWYDAMLALRHWIGRGPGQDVKLYNRLIEATKYKPREAEIFIHLLYGFDDEQLKKPETYEALIDYLESDRPALRAMAHWHLVRLVPEGKELAFNPLGAKAEREKCCKEWEKMVPAGKVPPRPKPREK